MQKKKKYESNKKGCGVKTFVKGVRADKAFWDLCEKTATLEGASSNALIVYAVKNYCYKILSRKGVDNGN